MRCQHPMPCYIKNMMTSSNGNITRVTGLLRGKFIGRRWLPLAKTSDTELWCFLWSTPEQTVEQTIADDLRRHRAHYDVNVMIDLNSKSQSWAYCPYWKVREIKIKLFSNLLKLKLCTMQPFSSLNLVEIVSIPGIVLRWNDARRKEKW